MVMVMVKGEIERTTLADKSIFSLAFALPSSIPNNLTLGLIFRHHVNMTTNQTKQQSLSLDV